MDDTEPSGTVGQAGSPIGIPAEAVTTAIPVRVPAVTPHSRMPQINYPRVRRRSGFGLS